MRIAIDAGHGSNTPGKRTPPLKRDVDIDGDGQVDIRAGEQYREHYASVGVCAMLDGALRRCGFETLKVSWDDADGKNDANMPLAARQAMIRAAGCRICVSVHFNAWGDGTVFNSASGVCTYIHSNRASVGESRELAERIQRNLAGGTAQRNRGVKEAGFAMCSCPATGTRAAILCELAFMTNEYEASLMTNADFWAEAAEEICRGICEYTGAEYREEEEMSYNKFLEYMERYRAELADKPAAEWGQESDEAIKWAEDSGIIRGDEQGRKQYQAPLTRQAYILMEYRRKSAD